MFGSGIVTFLFVWLVWFAEWLALRVYRNYIRDARVACIEVEEPLWSALYYDVVFRGSGGIRKFLKKFSSSWLYVCLKELAFILKVVKKYPSVYNSSKVF